MARFGIVAALLFCLCAAPLSARDWTSRAGESLGEAELVDAGQGIAVLKQAADGKLKVVPFVQLSLGDLQYIREAMNAAGVDLATHKPVVPAGATASPTPDPAKPGPASPSTSSTTPAKQDGPPLAVDGRGNWQVAVDPAREKWTVSQTPLRILLPKGFSQDDVLFASTPSPFVLAGGGSSRDGVRELWDLKRGERVNVLRQDLTSVLKSALSPDGRYLATSTFRATGQLSIWALETNSLLKEITLSEQSESMYGLDFATPSRIVVSLSSSRAIVVLDVNSGERVSKIDVESPVTADRYAISAGGNYLALAKDNRLELYDLRNGVLAGELPIDTGKSGYLQVKGIGFSSDGEEVAVLVDQSLEMHLLCWAMKSGSLSAKHLLRRSEIRMPSSGNSRQQIIDWLHGGKGWLLAGTAIVDREKGGPIWIADDGISSITRGVRRVIDDQRFLVLRGDYQARSLVTEPIPWETITEAQRVVSQGGKLQDVGRPDVTPVDWSGNKSLTLSTPSGTYQPASLPPVPANLQPFTHTRQQGQPKSLFLLSADAYRVLVSSQPEDYNKRLKGMELSQSGQNADVFDLASGKHLYSFVVPFAADLLGVSPTARQGIFCEMQSKDRVDVFNLQSGAHRVAFRPARQDTERASSTQSEIAWADFLDEDHVLTLTKGGELVHWSLEGCRANYSLTLGSSSKVFLTPTRSHCLVTTPGNTVHLLETATGACCARLTFPNQAIPAPVSDVTFRSDGRLVALLLFLGDKRRLLVWDLQRNGVVSDVMLPFGTLGMSWCGRAHVALHNTNIATGTGPPRTQQRITVVDVATQRVVWNYMAPIGTKATDGPGDRLWGLVPDASYSSRQFVGVTLPDPEAARIIAAAPPPAPLFGPGTKVALKINIGGLPDELPDRREREDRLAKSLDEHFRSALGKAGTQIDDSAPVTLEVSLKNLTQEEILVIGSRYSYNGVALIVLSTKSVHARLAIRQGADRVLWEQQNFVEAKDVDTSGTDRNTSLTAQIRLRQWEQAEQWCQATPLPTVLYHPGLQAGLGESQLDALSTRLLRTYPPPAP